MIIKIYRSAMFRYSACFLIGIILSGCYSEYIVRDLNYSDTETSSVLKIYLKDGRTLDLTDRKNQNQITGFNEYDITYKNHDGVSYKIFKETIDHLYNRRFSFINTVLCALGVAVVLFFGFIALAFHGIGSPGG